MGSTQELNKEELSLVSNLTHGFTDLIDALQNEYPDRKFSIEVFQPNRYWSIHWKSSKLWKTEKPLNEFFSIRLYPEKNNYTLLGEHNIKDIFEHLNDRYFFYQEKSIHELMDLTGEIIPKTKASVLKAVDQEFDPSF